MNPLVEKAHEAISLPEVQELLRKLSSYGLGVFMPHMHDPETGDYVALSLGMVSVEKDLQVSFHDASAPEVAQSRPVGWVWNSGTQTAMVCTVCYEVSGRHGKANH